jgi:quinol-cytochrome oxidoreductase complex cytochrome b subunit
MQVNTTVDQGQQNAKSKELQYLIGQKFCHFNPYFPLFFVFCLFIIIFIFFFKIYNILNCTIIYENELNILIAE